MLVSVLVQNTLGIRHAKVLEVDEAVRIVLAHNLNEPMQLCWHCSMKADGHMKHTYR